MQNANVREKTPLTRSDGEVEFRFNALLAKWREETAVESNFSRIVMNRNYRGIVALGPQVVPLILKDMAQGRGGAWFQALEDLTGENPIPAEHETDSALMRSDWLAWGKHRGLV